MFEENYENSTELWYEEKLELKRGVALKIKIENILCSHQSKFQKIEVFETKPFGRMLVIDGIVMLTEADEFCYHEMITHVGMCVHPKPENVLIIGGGDGGTVREVLKHPEVKKVDLCEIDEDVIRISKKFFPNVSKSLTDKKVNIKNKDGAEFVKDCKGKYDIIIVDSTDPIGPGKTLFEEEFYKNVYKSLKDDGIAIAQCESIFYHLDFISKTSEVLKKIFPIFSYYYTLIPTYPSGMIGFAFCSKKYHPIKDFKMEKVNRLKNLRYYNPETHKSSFSLPNFAKTFL
ncbi:MAG: polyamine aminopropyltransferase [Candidatus Aenigmatarchaeota archaeon]